MGQIDTLADREWIPVSEKLPEYDYDVAVAFDQIGVYMGQYINNKWRLNGHLQPAFQKITHWMALPPAPTTTKGE